MEEHGGTQHQVGLKRFEEEKMSTVHFQENDHPGQRFCANITPFVSPTVTLPNQQPPPPPLTQKKGNFKNNAKDKKCLFCEKAYCVSAVSNYEVSDMQY